MSLSPNEKPTGTASPPEEARETMNRKPVLYRDAGSVLTLKSTEFQEKLLCDGIVFNPGDACAYSCEFCYVKGMMWQTDHEIVKRYNKEAGQNLDFHEVVIRRRPLLEILSAQLLRKGKARFSDLNDNRVVFGSTTVDVAANMVLLKETASACNLIFEHTNWQVRLLSKSNLLHLLVKDLHIPAKHHSRLILGYSTGTLDDRVAKAIESGTPFVTKRLQGLHWLQDRGLRTFGMICPSLPQDDYDKFSREICQAIRVDRCEHVWAEVINVRGKSLTKTIAGLQREGLGHEAKALAEVSASKSDAWEKYARQTFLAHTKNVPASKLRFLQYIDEHSRAWWTQQRAHGGILLGAVAKGHKLTTNETSTAAVASLPLSEKDEQFKTEREAIVTAGVKASIAAAKALHEIFNYKSGILWKRQHPSFADYCRDRWDYGKAHSYRLVECGDFITELEKQSPIGDCLPKNESQVRPLLAFPREVRVGVWNSVVATIEPDKLTAKLIAAKAGEHAEAKKITRSSTPGSRRPKVDAAFARLRATAKGHRNSRKILSLLEEVESLMA